MIYLLCFAISVLLAYYANKAPKKQQFWLFSVLSIAVVVLLAGLRDYNVGVDASNYYSWARYWGNAIQKESLFAYLKYYFSLDYGEPLFALILGSVARLTGNFSVFLCVVHGIIITGVYIGAVRMKAYAEPSLVLAVFYLVYFGQSLNIMRQYMAMAIIFAVFADIHEKKWLRYGIAVVAAALIHNSAILALLPLFVYVILYAPWKPLDTKKWYRWGVVVGLTLLALLLLLPAVQLAMHLGILGEKYRFYFDADIVSPAVVDSVVIAAGLCAVYYFRTTLQKHCEFFSFYALNSVVYLLLLQFSWFVIYGKRLAIYQAFANLITVAMVEKVQTDKRRKWLARIAIVGMAFAYWLYVYAFRNASETMPYKLVF